MRREFLLAGLVGLMFALAARCAYADASETELATARQLFAEGVELEEKGDWAAALQRFRKVAAIKLTPQLRYNLGICLIHTGELVEAMNELSPVATLSGDKKTADLALLAQRELLKLRLRIPQLVVTLPAGLSGDVTLDGRSIHPELLGTPILVDPGVHTVAVRRPGGGESVAREVRLTEGAGPVLVALDLPKEGPRAETVVTPWHGRIPPSAYISGGASLAAFGGAIVMAALRGGAIATLNGECGVSHQTCPSSAHGEYGSLQTYTIAADVLLGVGIAGAGAAGAFVYFAPSATPSTHGSTLGASVTGRF